MQGHSADLIVPEVGHLPHCVHRPIHVHSHLRGGEVGSLHIDLSVALAVASDAHANEGEAGEVLVTHDELALDDDVGT